MAKLRSKETIEKIGMDNVILLEKELKKLHRKENTKKVLKRVAGYAIIGGAAYGIYYMINER